jgi:hypothetical protein
LLCSKRELLKSTLHIIDPKKIWLRPRNSKNSLKKKGRKFLSSISHKVFQTVGEIGKEIGQLK